jgi:5-methylcytosine-specific restriction endonuclease McrA
VSTSYVSKALREKITEQARRRCGYCQSQQSVSGVKMEVDHIIPESVSGLNVEENLWLSCTDCNDYKNKRFNGTDEEIRKPFRFSIRVLKFGLTIFNGLRTA